MRLVVFPVLLVAAAMVVPACDTPASFPPSGLETSSMGKPDRAGAAEAPVAVRKQPFSQGKTGPGGTVATAAVVRPGTGARQPASSPNPGKTGRVTQMELETFFPRQQEGTVLVFDVRPSFVRAFGAIPGSAGWPKGDFESCWAEQEPRIRAAAASGKPVVVYCTDLACPDARTVAEKIAARGYDVAVLAGGFAGWKEAGMQTE